MDSDTIIQRVEHVAWSNIDDEAILLNLENGFYYTLNEVGCDAWQLLDGKRTLGELGLELCQLYDAEQQQIEQDLCSIFQEMQQEALIRTVS